MQYPAYLRLVFQPVGDLHRAELMLPKPDSERPQPSCGEIGVVGAYILAETLSGAGQGLPLRRGRGDRSHHQVGMTGDIFGDRHDREVDALADRLEKEGRGPCVVQQGGNSARFRHGADSRHVLHLESQ